MLDRHDAARRKAAAVSNAVDFVDNGDPGIACQQKIAVERVRRTVSNRVDRPAGCNQRLTDDLTAKNALPADLRRTASKQIYLDRFKIEGSEQILNGRVHGLSRSSACDAQMYRAGTLGICVSHAWDQIEVNTRPCLGLGSGGFRRSGTKAAGRNQWPRGVSIRGARRRFAEAPGMTLD